MQKKLLKKLVEKCLKNSFVNSKIDTKKSKKYVDLFKKMDLEEAIFTLNLYMKGLKRFISDHSIEVESSANLSKLQLNVIKKQLGSKYALYPIAYTLNPSILGGIKVKIGDMSFDDSLENKISQVKGAIAG